MLEFLRWPVLAAEVVVAVPVAYLCVVSAAALARARRRPASRPGDRSAPPVSFAILVPAHNEEALLGSLLGSLAALDYPREHFAVHVVADNCTDGTTEVVAQFDWARVHERRDETRRGKGYALRWLMDRLEAEHCVYDAYVIVDADSVVDPAFLRSLAASYRAGASAMQACYAVLNPAESPATALRWLALTLINHVRPLGRTGIGGSSALTGNGMCLSRELLGRYPWDAFGPTEDYQYYLGLAQRGVRIAYVPEARVWAHMPPDFGAMRQQDIRWESSAPGVATWRIAGQLLGAGLRCRDWMRLEAALELVTPPLSALVAAAALTLVASAALGFRVGVVLGALLLGGLALHILSALAVARPPKAIVRVLPHTPGFILWKLWVRLVLRRRKRYLGTWARTSRPAAVK